MKSSRFVFSLKLGNMQVTFLLFSKLFYFTGSTAKWSFLHFIILKLRYCFGFNFGGSVYENLCFGEASFVLCNRGIGVYNEFSSEWMALDIVCFWLICSMTLKFDRSSCSRPRATDFFSLHVNSFFMVSFFLIESKLSEFVCTCKLVFFLCRERFASGGFGFRRSITCSWWSMWLDLVWDELFVWAVTWWNGVWIWCNGFLQFSVFV